MLPALALVGLVFRAAPVLHLGVEVEELAQLGGGKFVQRGEQGGAGLGKTLRGGGDEGDVFQRAVALDEAPVVLGRCFTSRQI